MQRSPPAYYLAFNIFMWGQYGLHQGAGMCDLLLMRDDATVGVLLCCQAAAKNFATLAALRVLSGA